MKEIIKKLKDRFFPSEDEKAWKAWVDFKDREDKDLIDLFSADVRPEFKRRATFLLLVPYDEYNSFYWKKELGKFYHNSNFLELLSTEELNYAVDLVFDFYSELKFKHIGKRNIKVLKGDGMNIHVPITEKHHTALSFYNSCIIEFLILLPEERVRKLFSLFSLLDISAYYNMEYASGYNPFASLLSNQRVDERWKRLADFKMLIIIEKEVSGKVAPREEWERAFSQYVSIFQNMLYKAPRYSKDLYARQLKFILEKKDQNPVIHDWQVIRIFELLSDLEYKALRYNLAEYVLSEKKNGVYNFSICSKESQDAVDWIVKEFSYNPVLMERIKFLEKERDERDFARKLTADREAKKENDIMSDMK